LIHGDPVSKGDTFGNAVDVCDCEGAAEAVAVSVLKPGMIGRDGSVGMESHHPLEDALSGWVEVERTGGLIFPLSSGLLVMKVIAPNASMIKIPKIKAVVFCC